MERSGEAGEDEPEVWDRPSLDELERRIEAGDRESWTTSWGLRRRQASQGRPSSPEPARRDAPKRGKSRALAILLALLIGGLGAHRFYLGNIAWGVTYLVFVWTGIPVILAFFEAISFLVTSDEAWAQEHGGPVRATSTVTLGCLWMALLLPVLAVVAGIVLIGPMVWPIIDFFAEERIGATYTLLPDGRVLVVGGGGVDLSKTEMLEFNETASARIWDPETDESSPAGTLAEGRSFHDATRLPDGRVLVVGGDGADGIVAAAEVWDPVTNDFAPAGSLEIGRKYPTTTVLPDARVLVVGGDTDEPISDTLASAEVWDPETNGWAAAGSLDEARREHTATLLPDGRVLVVGGVDWYYEYEQLASAEVWDPATNEFSSAGSLPEERYEHTATLLPDGRVLVIGGFRKTDGGTPTMAFVWDPATSVFTPAGSLPEARMSHTATLLPDGRVLVIGGEDMDEIPDIDYFASVLVWDPTTNDFAPAGSLAEARSGHSATLLPDGRIAVLGGRGESRALARVEIWDPSDA